MSLYEDTLKKNCKVMDMMLYATGNLERPSGGYNMIYMCAVALLKIRSNMLATRSIYLGIPDNLETVIYHTVALLSVNLAVMKFINFVNYRTEFSKLRKIIEEKFWAANVASPLEEQEVILRYSRYVHFVSILQCVNCILAGITWISIPILTMYVLRAADQPFQRRLPLQPWLPFLHIDWYADPVYQLEYFIQLLQTLATVVNTIGQFCLYVYFVLHTCAQFKLLQMRVKNFNTTKNGSKATVGEQEEKIRGCIQLHQELLHFCSRIINAFSMPLFFECFSAALFLCTSGYALKLFPGNLSVYSFCFVCTFTATYITLVSNFVANLLTTESFNVAFSAYDSDWYDAPVHLQKEIMLMITRSQEGLYFTAGGFANLSLETFESIMRTAFSYFTVLNTVGSNE